MIIKKPYVLESMDKKNKDVWIFRFRAQDNAYLDFTPGMFAMLFYKDPGTGEEIGRAFSIANEPPSTYFEFMIAMIHGQMTSKLEQANAGDVYYISAPYGQFKFDINSCKKPLFIAGGTGIAPFFSMLRFAKSVGISMSANMIYSIRYPYDIIEKDVLDGFVSDGIKLTITVTRPQPGDGWTGQTGHIDAEMIKKYAPDFAGRECYICGPPNFVKAIKEVVMGLGVPEGTIRAEMWGE
jgi:ferredoxin-NADP reductase